MNKEKSSVQESLHSKDDVYKLANCCWQLSVVALWPSIIISADEEAAALSQWSRCIKRSADPYKTYLEFSQRVLLTRRKMMEDAGYGISSLPCRFLNSTEKGFKLSKAWYKELLEGRKKSRLFKIELMAIAEAILEFAEDPSIENFNYWKTWFIENESPDEWMLFNLTAAPILLLNKSLWNKQMINK